MSIGDREDGDDEKLLALKIPMGDFSNIEKIVEDKNLIKENRLCDEDVNNNERALL